MNDRDVIIDTCSEICNNFCKFAGTGDGNKGCVWCLLHDNKCPLDNLMKMVEEIDDGK